MLYPAICSSVTPNKSLHARFARTGVPSRGEDLGTYGRLVKQRTEPSLRESERFLSRAFRGDIPHERDALRPRTRVERRCSDFRIEGGPVRPEQTDGVNGWLDVPRHTLLALPRERFARLRCNQIVDPPASQRPRIGGTHDPCERRVHPRDDFALGDSDRIASVLEQRTKPQIAGALLRQVRSTTTRTGRPL